ncbi:MAG: polysulfide reductase NrfD [ANME-2 cluster archaeon]|nr:polysulfide reductase NrfD [ANME-2 cluster archaeon]
MKITKTMEAAWFGLLILAILAGLYTVLKAFQEGQVIYGGTDTLFWTIPLAAYTYFALISTGLAFVASASIIFGVERYKPLVNRALFVAIAAFGAGIIAIIMELGYPGNIMNYITSPNLTSSIWWETVMLSVFFIFLLVNFWMVQKGKKAMVPAVVLFIFAIGSSSTLGGSFGLVESRPAFFGEFMPVYFLFTALLGGIAGIVFVTLIYHNVTSKTIPEEQKTQMNKVGRDMAIVTGFVLIIFISRTIIKMYSNSTGFAGFEHIFTHWPYYFELGLGLLLPILLMAIPSVRASVKGKVIASFLVLIGILAGRISLLMSGQVNLTGSVPVGLSEIQTYSPTIWEWLVLIFAMSTMLLIYTLGEKYLNLETT